jgi:hypothetical protein
VASALYADGNQVYLDFVDAPPIRQQRQQNSCRIFCAPKPSRFATTSYLPFLVPLGFLLAKSSIKDS